MFAQFDCHTAFGKMLISVKIKKSSGDDDARRDAVSVAQSEFGVSSRVSVDFIKLKKPSDGSFEARSAKGWAFIKRA